MAVAVQSGTKITLGKGGDFRTITAKGVAVTGTAGYSPLLALAQAGDKINARIMATPRNFATAVVVKVGFNPWLTVLKTTDAMATLPTDYSIEAQDGLATTDVDLSSLDTVANGDWLLVGSHQPFRGVWCDVDGTNTSTVTLSIHYWRGSWIDSGATLSGVTATKVLDQDGLVYWTVPASWQKATFRKLYPNITATAYYSDVPLYWTRWSGSAALDSTTTLDGMVAANRSTAYGELVEGQMISKDDIIGFGGLGCIEAATDTETANLVVNIFTLHGSELS